VAKRLLVTCLGSNREVGVLIRNIAGSARFVSYGTGPSGYIGYVAWRAGTKSANLAQPCLKGQCHEIFCFWFFSWISFSPAPEYSIKTVLILFENLWRYCSSRFATGVNDTGGRWKKSSIRKVFNILFGHLWVVELTYIYINFCLQVHFNVSAAWYCSYYWKWP